MISNCSRDRCCLCFPFSVPLLCASCSAWPLLLQARETGICPVREELYAQCFDELIREVTINCAERGLLLLRVRDEMHMTIAAYQVGWLCSGQNDNIKSLCMFRPAVEQDALLACTVYQAATIWCILQTLYESSIAFGMRKALQTEQGKGDMEGRIGTLEADTKDFERQVRFTALLLCTSSAYAVTSAAVTASWSAYKLCCD